MSRPRAMSQLCCTYIHSTQHSIDNVATIDLQWKESIQTIMDSWNESSTRLSRIMSMQICGPHEMQYTFYDLRLATICCQRPFLTESIRRPVHWGDTFKRREIQREFKWQLNDADVSLPILLRVNWITSHILLHTHSQHLVSIWSERNTDSGCVQLTYEMVPSQVIANNGVGTFWVLMITRS